jgi:peptidyl-prolyl cis-trans isomerase SurA
MWRLNFVLIANSGCFRPISAVPTATEGSGLKELNVFGLIIQKFYFSDITMFKRFLSVLLLLPLLSPSFLAAKIIDRVVAEVNDDVITLSELNEEGKEILQRINDQAPADQVEEALKRARKEVLARMIDRKITVQMAEKMNITATEPEIDSAIQSIIAQNKTTEQIFKKELAALGISETAYRNSIREQILQSKLLGYEVNSKIVVTEEKAREYYKNTYMRNIEKDGYYLLQIGFIWDGSSPREAALERAREAWVRAMAGEKFTSLARAVSELPSAYNGGDIGVVKALEMAPEMQKTVTALRPGEISAIVETAATAFFFKLLAVNREGKILSAPFESVREDIFDILRQEEHEKLYNKWVQKLRGEAYIKELL